ncbi:siderophore-interacting protein [Aureimonas sp. ME7]|uniref:siderophore-interacting protein n=1 Tax=Aureimonas sp. ME7 TaxID=2744252 RepID=UPI0015F55D78|nr:siderophore-interacting protein [Aureimonas sp. ME7]
MLQSNLSIRVDDRDGFMRHLLEHLDEDQVQRAEPDGETVVSVYNSVTRLRFEGDRMAVVVEGTDPADHGVAKGLVAWYVQHILGDDCPEIVWAGDGADTRELPHFRELTVVSSTQLTPRMRRVRLSGANLQRFAGEELHVRLLFPPKGRTPVWPHAGPAALPVWPTGEDELIARVYTIREIDAEAGHLDIDVVLHDPPGAGCAWSREAQAGDFVGMLGPGGGLLGPGERHLILGDETALPAIARMLKRMDAGVRADVFIEVAGPEEEQALVHPDSVSVRWLHRNGAPAGTTTLLEDAARSAVAPGETPFVWSGTEFSAFKAIRRFCRKDLGLKKNQHLVAAYWRRGQRQGEGVAAADDDG